MLRYRRVGPEQVLEAARKSPRGIGFKEDLYSLPPGGIANGMTGDQLETRLGSSVDGRFPKLSEKVCTCSGELKDVSFRRDVVWLMQTFAARSPTSITRVERGVSELLQAQGSTIDRLLARANTESTRAELRSFQDLRMPIVAARAGVAAVAARDLPDGLPWLDGDLPVVRLDLVVHRIGAIGAGEFVTFEDPVVEWDSGPYGLTASFVMSPAALVLVVERGRHLSVSDYEDAATRHSLGVLRYRENLICRSEVTGHMLAAAAHLRPSSVGMSARSR